MEYDWKMAILARGSFEWLTTRVRGPMGSSTPSTHPSSPNHNQIPTSLQRDVFTTRVTDNSWIPEERRRLTDWVGNSAW